MEGTRLNMCNGHIHNETEQLAMYAIRSSDYTIAYITIVHIPVLQRASDCKYDQMGYEALIENIIMG